MSTPAQGSSAAVRFVRLLFGGVGWRQVGRLLAAFLVMVVLTATLSTAAFWWYGERAIDRVDVPGLAQAADDSSGGSGGSFTDVLNVLVVGSDSRDELTEEQLQALGTEEDEGNLTDTIMLVQLDPRREEAALLSFPRDLLVTRCDGSEGRINAAYAIGTRRDVGGPSCLVQTVKDLTGVRVNHYVEVDFAGFIEAVDTVGGVSLYLREPLKDRYAGLDLDAGCVTLDGTDALSFVRARHLDNDFGRMARQQRFLRELVAEVTDAGTMLNIPQVLALVNSVGESLEVDTELSAGQMRRLASSLRDVTADQLDTRTVPAVSRQIDGAAYAVQKEDEAEKLFEAFAEQRPLPDGIGTSGTEEIGIDDLDPLVVLNGVGTQGLASDAADVLRDRGLEVAETANADDFGVDRTRVVHPPGHKEEAEVVAGVFDDPAVEADEDADELTVILGDDFDADELQEDTDGSAADGEAGSEQAKPPSGKRDRASQSPEYAGAASSDVEC